MTLSRSRPLHPARRRLALWVTGMVFAAPALVSHADAQVPAPAAPVVTHVSPDHGVANDTEIVVTGTGLAEATAVNFGLTPARSFLVISDGEIRAGTPAVGEGTVSVAVITADGSSPSSPGSRFTFVAPNIGTWSPAAACPAPCGGPAVLLNTGEVLTVGGAPLRGQTSDATRLYDPSSYTWHEAARMTTPRVGHSATLLPNGQVLVAGGAPKGAPGAEIYDPGSKRWHPTGSMTMPRQFHLATLLPDGRVLVAGGARPKPLSAELYDPVRGAWQATGSMLFPHFEPTATTLPDGRVLVVGQVGGDNPAELYDPRTGHWYETGSPQFGHEHHSASLLDDGRVLLVGAFTTLPSAELYDPASGTWRPTAQPHLQHNFQAAAVLPNGRVALVGGQGEPVPSGPRRFRGSDQVEVFNPTTGRWDIGASMRERRYMPTAILLGRQPCGSACGRLLVIGGFDFPPGPQPYTESTTAEMYTSPGREDSWALPAEGGSPARALAVGCGAAVAVVAAALMAGRRRRRPRPEVVA